MEFKIKNMQDKMIAYQKKIDKSYNVKYCIYNLIREKQEILESEKTKIIEDSETSSESDTSSDSSIKFSDIKLLDTYSEEELDEND